MVLCKIIIDDEESEKLTIETTSGELIIKKRVGRDITLARSDLTLNVVRLLLSLGFSTLLLAKGLSIVSLIPLTERSSIDLDNGTLDKSVGTDQLVVGGVVHNSQDTGLAGAVLGTPGEVTGIETKSTVLLVTTTNTDFVDTLGTKLGVGGLTTQLEPGKKVIEW
jgi:hypothetical protein